jgi:hypothetical protein
MRFSFSTLLLLSLVACRHPPEPIPPWNRPPVWSPGAETSGWRLDVAPLPESAEDNLSEHQRATLQRVRAQPVTVSIPPEFENSSTKREAYTNWFIRGYTFTKATGSKHHHHGLYRGVTPDRRPIINGWLDGQSEAEMERIQSILHDLTQEVLKEKGEPGGPANGRQPIHTGTNQTPPVTVPRP